MKYHHQIYTVDIFDACDEEEDEAEGKGARV